MYRPGPMSDLLHVLEMMENRWMRAWVAGDTRALKSLTSRKFQWVMGSTPCVILDYPSWIEAASGRYSCRSYRFGDSLYARDLGAVALFATHLQLEASIDGKEWSGQFWLTDLWQKSKLRRSWRMTQRLLSRPEEGPQVAGIASLQLWR